MAHQARIALSYVIDQAVREAYGELITRQRWDWFATLTFKPQLTGATGGVHPEKADKAFRLFCSLLNRDVFGKYWWKPGRPSVVWVRGQEFHKDGRIHFHALLAGPDRNLNDCASRYFWHEWWFREFGRNQIEVPMCQVDVAEYVAEYAAKDGEVDFSENFGAIPVAPLDFDFSGCSAPYKKPEPDECGELRGRVKEGHAEGQVHSLTLPVRLHDSQHDIGQRHKFGADPARTLEDRAIGD